MFRKKTRRLVSLLTVMILVWSQFVVAAYACPQLVPSVPMSAAMGSAMPDCDQMGQPEDQPAPLCKAHCEPSPQSNQTPSLDFPPSALAAVPETPRLDLAGMAPGPTICSDSLSLIDGSPPLRIQYQVFRI